MKHRHANTVLAAAISIAFASSPLAAQTYLEPVVVTASRMTVAADEALASVTVLTRADIEQSQAPDLLDLLSRQAGVDVARTGGPGQASTLFTRGSNSAHTLVLIDGIRVNAATQGVFDLAHLPLAQVERIEIVRGPRAAIWGSDAIGGVVQIFTRDPSTSFLEAGVGSYGRVTATAGLGRVRGESRFGLAAGASELRGFSATNSQAFGHDPDDDGYRNRNLGLRGRTRAGGHVLSFSGVVTSATVEFDQGRTQALSRVFGGRAGGDLSSSWSHAVTVGHSSEDLDTPAYASRFGSTRDSIDWLNTVAPGKDDLFNFGVNWSRETGYSLESGSGFQRSRRNAAVFATWRKAAAAHLLELSARRDHNSQFAGATTGSIAWGWQAGRHARLRVSWGEGFRAPNFNELYYPGFFGFFSGNPALRPEHSVSQEVGMDWTPDSRQSLGVSLYRTRISDLVAFQGVDFQAINVARASVDGAEFEYRLSLPALVLQANATWQDARDADNGMPLLRRAPRKLMFSATHLFANRALLGVDLSAVAARPDFGGVTLAGYGRVDVRASVPVANDWQLEARIENLGDRDYQLVNGYNTPGRSLQLDLRWSDRPPADSGSQP